MYVFSVDMWWNDEREELANMECVRQRPCNAGPSTPLWIGVERRSWLRAIPDPLNVRGGALSTSSVDPVRSAHVQSGVAVLRCKTLPPHSTFTHVSKLCVVQLNLTICHDAKHIPSRAMPGSRSKGFASCGLVPIGHASRITSGRRGKSYFTPLEARQDRVPREFRHHRAVGNVGVGFVLHGARRCQEQDVAIDRRVEG